MSIFFEEEIQKFKRNATHEDLKTLMSQDPRNKPNWSDRNRNSYSRQTFYRRNQRDSRSDDW